MNFFVEVKEKKFINFFYVTGPAAKKRGRGPSLKLGGVSVNAKSLLACEKELEPLDLELPANPEERNKWILELR